MKWKINMRFQEKNCKLFFLHKQRRRMESSCRCYVCNIDDQITSLAELLGGKTHEESLKFLSPNFSNGTNKSNPKRNPRSFEQEARENVNIEEKN